MLGIIFDCDGTLIDSEQVHFLSWNEALSKRGLALTEEDYHSLSGWSGTYISQKLREKHALDSAEGVYADKKASYHSLQKRGIAPIERMVRFVHQLLQQKEKLEIKLGLASAATRREIFVNLEHLGLQDAFDAVVSGSDDLADYTDPQGVNKPQPYIYLHTAKLLGIEPTHCVAFEDSGPGVLAAVRAGLTTFAVPNTHTKYHDFSPATYLIDEGAEIDLEDFFKKVRNNLSFG
jgi:beta-phosphoglucomutase